MFLGDSIEAAERQRARRRLASMDPKFALQAHHELLHLKHAARRRLQQRGVAEPEVELLSKLITDIGSMSRDQTSLGTTVAALEAAVTKAGNAQEARAADNTVAGLIAAGRADIASGHQRVDALLREIVEKQTSAAAAAEAMAAAVQQAADLAARIIQSQQAVEKNLQRQLQAISVAVQNRVITLADALTLWRKARLDRLKAMKRSLLMNMQTSNYTAVAYPFKLQRYNSTPRVIARERYIGTNNRIIAGMLLHTTRTTPVDCPPTRFNSVENVCAGPLDARQYGVDPVFKQGSSLYNPDLDNNQTIASYYNCSRLRIEPTYNVEDPFNPGTFTNQYPNCAELINMRGIPWGFHHFPMDYFERGYPVWFDINLNEQDAMRFYNYVEEGLYLDGHTRDVNAQVRRLCPAARPSPASPLRPAGPCKGLVYRNEGAALAGAPREKPALFVAGHVGTAALAVIGARHIFCECLAAGRDLQRRASRFRINHDNLRVQGRRKH